MEVRDFIDRCESIWWSPHPGFYYLDDAINNPGAFNVYWLATRIPLKGAPGHLEAVRRTLTLYSSCKRQFKEELTGLSAASMKKFGLSERCTNECAAYPLSEWAVNLKPDRFIQLLSQYRHWKDSQLIDLCKKGLQAQET